MNFGDWLGLHSVAQPRDAMAASWGHYLGVAHTTMQEYCHQLQGCVRSQLSEHYPEWDVAAVRMLIHLPYPVWVIAAVYATCLVYRIGCFMEWVVLVLVLKVVDFLVCVTQRAKEILERAVDRLA